MADTVQKAMHFGKFYVNFYCLIGNTNSAFDQSGVKKARPSDAHHPQTIRLKTMTHQQIVLPTYQE